MMCKLSIGAAHYRLTDADTVYYRIATRLDRKLGRSRRPLISLRALLQSIVLPFVEGYM